MNVSIIVPVRNGASTIGKLLNSLTIQTQKPEEFVIVDAGSKDRTKEIVQEYQGKGYPIKLISIDPAFPGKARNIGIQNSTSEILVMIDDGMIADRNWLKEIVKPLEDDANIDFVWGTYRPIVDNIFQKCQVFVLLSPPVKIEGRFIRYGSFASAAMRRDIFEKIGGFPENLRAGEDVLMRKKIEKSGVRTAITSQSVVFWDLESGLLDIIKKVFVYSKYRIFGGINTSYIFRLIIIYFLLSTIGLLTNLFFSLFLLISFLFIRIIRNIFRQEPVTKKLFLNPLAWILVIFLSLIIDISSIAGGLYGLVWRVSGRIVQ